jgi:steroid 5-alpha reductase family enzyme
MRDSGAKLLLPWMTQGLWAFLVSLPVTLTNTLLYQYRTHTTPHLINTHHQSYRAEMVDELTWRDGLGWSIWALGFCCEVLADQQKKRFAAKPANKDKFIDEGLWHYRSTHTPHTVIHTHTHHTHTHSHISPLCVLSCGVAVTPITRVR